MILKEQIGEYREKIATLEKDLEELRAGKPSDAEILSFKEKADGMNTQYSQKSLIIIDIFINLSLFHRIVKTSG